MIIREATSDDIATIATIISESNKDVAVRFGLTGANCPKHPSFCTAGWVEADLARGERYFVLEENTRPIACVAYEKPGEGIAYLNRLSVLPEHRRRGLGARLVGHIVDLARADSIHTISIGVIGEHEDLQRWYRKLGFVDGEIKRFPHLPFSVKYMSFNIPTLFDPMIIRCETPSDYPEIERINIDAFATHPFSRQTEHLIVDALREADALTVSLVAEDQGRVVGHIAFSPALIDGVGRQWFTLGPIAVTPDRQRRGIGSQLVKAGVNALRRIGANGCVLVGDPAFYERFGFRHGTELSVDGVPAEYFLYLPLLGAVPHGVVTHHPAFFVTA